MMNPTDAGPVSDASERIPVSISAPHVYLTQAAIEMLFCDKYRLHESLRTHQPTQYAAQESVTLIGPRGRLPDVRVIGPPRPVNQVEICRSDARTLGIDVPVRESGDLDGTPGVIIEGPRACVQLDRGVIRAQRHLHMTPEDADRLGLRDRDRVAVASTDAPRRVLFHDVLVHIAAECCLELHLNCDDGNAAALRSGDCVVLSKHPHTQQGTRRNECRERDRSHGDQEQQVRRADCLAGHHA